MKNKILIKFPDPLRIKPTRDLGISTSFTTVMKNGTHSRPYHTLKGTLDAFNFNYDTFG